MSPSAFEQLFTGGAEAEFPGWAVLVVEGAHRERFLQSQLTSDIIELEVGSSQQFALLDRSGRLQSFGFVLKRESRIELLLPEALLNSTVERLSSYIIADDVLLKPLSVPSMRIVLGAEALRRMATLPPDQVFPVQSFSSRGFVTWSEETELGLAVLSSGDLETLGVLSGFPRLGVEVEVGTLIHESTLVSTAVSFDKGCYLGQETVAKVQSGRGPAYAAMLLELQRSDIEAEDLVGKVFFVDSPKRAGDVRSLVFWKGKTLLHVRLARDFRVVGREIECGFEDGTVVFGQVCSIPFLSIPESETWASELRLRAVEEFTADREEEAIVFLERAIAVCPWYGDAYESLGVIFGRHRRFEEAIVLMNRLLEVDPTSVMAHTNLSLYYNQLGRIEDAEREAGEAMRAEAALAAKEHTQAERGREHMVDQKTERLRRADVFRQILELDADDPLANFGLGELLLEEERYEDAVNHLERSITSDPRQSAAYLAIGRAHEGIGDDQAARVSYRKGVEVAAGRGDLMTAKRMQERLAGLNEE